jgi:hypothetical protein
MVLSVSNKKKNWGKNRYFVFILEASQLGTGKKYMIRIRNSLVPVPVPYGPADLDKYQNVTDPEYTTEYKPCLPCC